MRNWAKSGILLLTGAVFAVVATFRWCGPDDAEIARLKDQLQKEQESSRLAELRADQLKKVAEELRVEFRTELERHEIERRQLEMMAGEAEARIAQLREESRRLRAEINNLMGKLLQDTEDELAVSVQGLVAELYPNLAPVRVAYAGDDGYIAGEEAVRGCAFGLMELKGCRGELDLAEQRESLLGEQVGLCEERVRTLQIDLSSSMEEADRWRDAEAASRFMAEQLKREAETARMLAGQYEKKLRVSRVVPDVHVGIGYGIDVRDGRRGPSVAVIVGWDVGLFKRLLGH